MKKCIYCGKDIADQAAWCPFCESNQQQIQAVSVPSRRRKITIISIAVLLLAGICVYGIVRYHAPKTYEGGAQIEYRINGEPCNVFLCFSSDFASLGAAEAEQDLMLVQGQDAATPSQLYVKKINAHHFESDLQDAFMEEVDSVNITSQPVNDSAPVRIYGPRTGAECSMKCAWVADIGYTSASAANTICWEIRMKNRDILRLYQTIRCGEIPLITYHHEDTPMDTVEQIEALIRQADEENPDAAVEMHLPPVTYTEPLTLDRHTVTLFGSETDEGKTTFTKTLTITTRNPDVMRIYNTDFIGEGGTGIMCSEGVRVQGSLISGWDVGFDVRDGGWASVNNAAFVGNKIGFRIDSHTSTYFNPNYENVVFAENELGLQIISTPADRKLNLINPVFDANKQDMDDLKEMVITD